MGARLTFLVLGLLLGVAMGGAVAWRVRQEADASAWALAKARRDVARLEQELDQLRRQRDEALRRAEKAERSRVPTDSKPDPGKQAKAQELLKLLEGE